jgi:hypothetical protein
MPTTKPQPKTRAPEVTSPRIASIASRVLSGIRTIDHTDPMDTCKCPPHRGLRWLGIKPAELKSMAGSLLTQAKDKPKKVKR